MIWITYSLIALIFCFHLKLFHQFKDCNNRLTRYQQAYFNKIESIQIQMRNERKESQIREEFIKENIKEKQESIGKIVETSTHSVEKVHKSISNIPFSLFESFSITKKTAKTLRKIHDKTSEGVYDSMREVNKQIGEITGEILKPEDKKNMDLPENHS